MRTRVGNLILASLAFMVGIGGEAGCRWAGSPPPRPRGPITIREILMDAILLFWFGGALGLFSRRRLAWIGSLVGTGASTCFFAVCLVTIVRSYIFPDAEMERIRGFGIGGYIAALVIAVVEFSVLLGVSLGLFIGLLRMRKELRQTLR